MLGFDKRNLPGGTKAGSEIILKKKVL